MRLGYGRGNYLLLEFLSLQEMEFERGIWQAAMDGDEGKVKRLIVSGTSPDATDSTGYTALVSPD